MFIRIIWLGFACFTAVAQFGKNAGFVYGKVVPEDPSLDMDSEMRALKIYGNAGNKLFFVDPANQMMSWYAALEFCQNHEMNLATITTEAENKIFQADNSAPKSFYSLGDHKKYFWLAGTDMADDGNFYWMGSKGHKEFDFKSWAPNKPSGGVRSNCVRTDENGEWSDAGCSRNHQPLCESVDNLNLIGRANHKQFWVQTSPYETKQLTWNEALEFCHRYDGMRLASFPTKFELDQLSQFFNNHTADAFWISLTDYEMEGTFKWIVTGKNLTYSNWGINEPSGGRQMNCVYLYHGGFENSTAEWFNDNCFRKHRPICETDTFEVKSAEFAYSYGDPVPEPSEIAKGTITTTVPSYIMNKGFVI